MKSFSQRTKESLCKSMGTKACCLDAELLGFLLFVGRLKGDEVRVSSESLDVMKRFAVLAKRSCGHPFLVENEKNNYFCQVSDEKLKNIALKYEKPVPESERGFKMSECCKSAFLRGAFLGGGTLVDPSKNYNMEFITSNKQLCEDFAAFLTELDLLFKQAERKNSFLLYSKQSDTICDALSYMGAYSAQMDILNVKIEKEIRNDWNRINNSESANYDKVIMAAIGQIKAINKIEETIGLESLSQELRDIAILRKENKNLSLEELGKKLVPPLSKSGVNHRMKKLINLAEGIK